MLLGIDLGTSGAKALVIDEAGKVRGSATEEYPLSIPRAQWSEQSPADWWGATCRAIRRAVAASAARPDEIAGIGLTGQMHGLVLLDAADQVLRPAILWNDQRTGPQCEEITRRAGGLDALLRMTGNAVLPGFTAPKLLWVRQNEPDIWARAASFLLPKDYIRLRLTGDHATEVSDASGTSLFDVERRKWSSEMAALVGVPEAWLAHAVESPDVAGCVGAEGAEATGLHKGTPVVGGAGDQAAQAVGSGVVQPGIISVTSGTSGVVFAYQERYAAEPEGRLQVFCHALPGAWHAMGVVLSAGGAFRWFRDALGQAERAVAQATGEDPYEILTREAAAAPPGCEGLLFLPYLMGERIPHADPNARGAFAGLTLRHGKSHMVRSVLEGVSFGLRDSLELVKGLGVPIEQVRASGGGARSALWRQIQADVFDVDLALTDVSEGAAFGAALLAGVGAGIYSDVQAAAGRTVHVASSIRPEPSAVAVYEKLYPVYRGLYGMLKPAFEALA